MKHNLIDRIFIRKAHDRLKDELLEDGGKGSGNFGHKGRPGMIGGSGKGGGKEFRTTSRETASGFIGVQRAKAFKSIATNARAHANDYRAFAKSLTMEQQNQLVGQYELTGKNESFTAYAKRLHKIMAARPAEPTKEKNKPVNGQNISATYRWDRATSKFDDEIEDVIHTQGFDGVPKIVSQAEIDKIIKENPQMPVLFRSYSAPNEDVLQTYDDMLEHGEWYVDCSTGGAQYGQGMYCAGVYGMNKDYSHAIDEMKHYRELNEDKIRDYAGHDFGFGYDQDNPPKIMTNADNGDYPTLYERVGEKQSLDLDQIKDGEYYALTFEIPGNHGREMSTLVTRRKGEIELITQYHADDIDDWLAKMENRNPAMQKLEALPELSAVSSTRMMTLDPSAKIITYDEARKLREKSKLDYINNQIYGMEREFQQANGLDDEDLEYMRTHIRLWRSRFGKKQNEEAINNYQMKTVRNGHTASGKTMEEITRAFIDYQTKRNELEDRIKQTSDYQKYDNMDVGTLAAMHGYDAINAMGHGLSDSYTVILNRTKLILSEQRVKV